MECEHGGDAHAFTGYEIEQVRLLADRVGWTPSEYTFECFTAFKDIMDDLVTNNPKCDLAAAGITRSTERESRGIKFTYPTYRASLGIIVRASVRERSYWGFLSPLHWSVWLATILTALAVPWVVFVIESIACHGFVHAGDWIPGVKDATWHSIVALINFGHFQVHSTAARAVVMGYGFLVLIIVNTYVANLAAFLTATQVDTRIADARDLFGQRVGTVKVYETQLRRLGITPAVIEQARNGIS